MSPPTLPPDIPKFFNNINTILLHRGFYVVKRAKKSLQESSYNLHLLT